ncbi:hypothetical protein F5X99DRAFT_397641, partial [Biscogniauxia marginata]
MAPKSLITVFRREFPLELFLMYDGRRRFKLRVPPPMISGAYDIAVKDGLVEPKALDPSTYEAPNGLALRPNSPVQQSLVQALPSGIMVYAFSRGTHIPEDLLLLHEQSDHYSLQPAVRMTINELNGKITSFIKHQGYPYTTSMWLRLYPEPTFDPATFKGYRILTPKLAADGSPIHIQKYL